MSCLLLLRLCFFIVAFLAVHFFWLISLLIIYFVILVTFTLFIILHSIQAASVLTIQTSATANKTIILLG